MKATESKLNDFLSSPKTRFVIPIYQRNYDWQDHHCSQLFSDVLATARDANRTSHFIGSIVFLHDGLFSPGKVKDLVIIDGQQRLTTVSLLYVALYRFATNNDLEEDAVEIKETYLTNRFAKDRKEKLWPTEENDRIYQRILKGLSEEGESFSRLRENYAYFSELIRDKSTYDALREGLGKLSFVEISLERNQDDPQRIFESLNSTGLALSQADLIRNYILMGHNREEQERLYDEYWREIEREARNDENRKNLVSDFVRDLLTFRNKKIPRKNQVYDTFKVQFPDRSPAVVENLLSVLRRFAGHFGKLINPAHEQDVDIRRELQYIRRLEINVSYPFLMQVYDDYVDKAISKEEFVAVLKLVQTFSWRRFLLSLPTAALNKIYMRLYEDIRRDDYVPSLERSLLRKKGTQRMPDDAEVRTILRERDMYNMQSKNRSYYLDRLENHDNRERVEVDNLTIEHIFPQKPAGDWKTSMTVADYEFFEEKHLHQLGNLTLSGNNGSLSNKTFSAKKVMNKGGKEQGYAFSRLWLNRDLAKLDAWTVDAFKKRQRRLTNRMLQIWPYPETELLDVQHDREELTIFEVDNPTGYQIEYAIIDGERLEPRSVKEFYIAVLSHLFAKDPHPMMQPDVKDTIYLERNDPKARDGEGIGRGYSVDAANSSWVKFHRLSTVLTAYDFEEGVRVKFREG